MRPPPLPAKVLARVLSVATFDGRTVLFIAGTLGLLSALGGDWYGALVGTLIAGAGAVELHGASLLRSGEARGLDWLVRSQLLLLNLILVYVAIQVVLLYRFGLNGIFSQEVIDALKSAGLSNDEQGRAVVKLVRGGYAAVGALTLLYQGSMALYYRRQRAVIRQALEQAAAREPVAVAVLDRPGPAPDKVLRRVLRIATLEGWSVLVLGTLSALLSAVATGWFGAVVGTLVAGCGAMELHGAALLRAGHPRGVSWLVRSQLTLLTVILLYAVISFITLTPAQVELIQTQMPTDDRNAMNQMRELLGETPAAYNAQIVGFGHLVYAVVAGLTVLYQGGMALYYHRRGVIIRRAMEQTDDPSDP